MTTFYLPYNMGKKKVKVDVPKGVEPHLIEPLPLGGEELDKIIKTVVQHPLFLSFAKKVKGKEVAVIVDDHTRPTPVAKVLPHLLSKMEKAERIKIIYARGTHDMPPSHFLEEKVGKEILSEYEFIIHDAYKEEFHSFCGITRFSTPVWMNKEVVNAQIRMAIGSIFPSELAGFTGGYKILLPGVSSYETINKHHSLALSHTARFGKIRGNIFRQDIDEAGRMVGLDFLLDFVIDVKRGRYHVFFPHPIKAHREGAALCAKIYKVKRRKYELVIVSPGGVEDVEFVQTMKALYVANTLCADGGTILILAACPLGLGWMELYQLLCNIKREKMKKENILRQMIRGEVETLAGFFAYIMYPLFLEQRKKIFMLSDGVQKEYLEAFGIEKVESVQDLWDYLCRKNPPKECCVLPYAACMWVTD